MLYNIVLISTLQQRESAIGIHMFPYLLNLSPAPLSPAASGQVVTEYQVELPELYSSFQGIILKASRGEKTDMYKGV